jgi:hypothetical protein
VLKFIVGKKTIVMRVNVHKRNALLLNTFSYIGVSRSRTDSGI